MPARRRAAVGIASFSLALVAVGAAIAPATVLQSGNLRLTLLAQVLPNRLPRHEDAPVAVFVSGHVAAVKQGVPSQLEGLRIQINRHGRLRPEGIPDCPVKRIQPSTTEEAVSRCSRAIVGSGQFWAHIVLPDQTPYPTHGRLLVFNGTKDGKPAVLAHIFTASPFATSFVIPFAIKHLRDGGSFGTELAASLPRALGDWGFVDRIKLTLRREFHQGGKRHGFFNASCPAPPDTTIASFPIAVATFAFAEEGRFALRVNKACKVKGE